MTALFLLLVVAASLTACAPNYTTFPYHRDQGHHARVKNQTVANHFFYYSLVGNARNHELIWEETEGYQVFLTGISWKIADEEEAQTLEFTYLKSKLPGKKRTVIVMPIYSRKQLHELLPLFLASYLSHWNQAADFNVIFFKGKVEHDPFDLDSLAEINSQEQTVAWMRESVRRFRRVVTGLRAVLDWAESEDTIDSKRIGIVGLSTSASLAAVAAGVDRRIAATIFFAGGVNLHEILSEASEPRIKQLRATLRAKKVPWESLLNTASLIFEPVDPLKHAGNLNPAKTLFFDTEFDEYVTPKTRADFWRASGKPKRVTFRSGHRDSFLALTPLGLFSANRIIIDFFRQKL